MQLSTPINWEYTNDLVRTKELLDSLPDLIACDFETAPLWTPSEQKSFKERAPYATKWNRIKLNQKASATGLSHPSLVTITHLSIAWSDSDSFVIVLDDDELRDYCLNWLVTTERTQIWHNSSFDIKHINYHTGKFPINYEDSQILAKTLLNDVDNFKSQTGLKTLMQYKFGDWSLGDTVPFTLDNIYDERMLYYAAIDSCATYALWEDIHEQLNNKD